jgi:hypothetical protein
MTSMSSAAAAGVTGIAGMPTCCVGAFAESFVGAVTSCANVELDTMHAVSAMNAALRPRKLDVLRMKEVVCMVLPEKARVRVRVSMWDWKFGGVKGSKEFQACSPSLRLDLKIVDDKAALR